VVLAALALYLATAARDVMFGDNPELTGVALTFGVAHPPGYPLFTMLGWLVGHIPVEPPPFRIVLLSVVSHTATLGVTYAATLRFTGSVAGAAVAAALLAVEPLFWSWSLVAEVFPLNDLLAVTMLFLVALWHEAPQQRWLLAAGGLAGGLGIANHQSIVLLAPAVLFAMWRRRVELLKDPALIAFAVLAFVAGLLPYVALPLASASGPLWGWKEIGSLDALVGHFLREEYGTLVLASSEQLGTGSLPELVAEPFTVLGPLYGAALAVGALWALRTRTWYAVYLLIGFVLAGPLFVLYVHPNLSDPIARWILHRFLLMSHAVVAPVAGFAVVAAAGAARRAAARARTETIAAGAVIAAALITVALNYARLDQSANHVARDFANDLFGTLPPGAVFVTRSDQAFVLEYLQKMEGVRPDVAIVSVGRSWSGSYRREMSRRHPDVDIPFNDQVRALDIFRANLDRHPISFARFVPENEATDAYDLQPRGLVYDVRPRGQGLQLEEMAAQSRAALAAYRIPRASELTGVYRAWERIALFDYAMGFARVGFEYEFAAKAISASDPARARTLYAEARGWLQRALAVEPALPGARERVESLPK